MSASQLQHWLQQLSQAELITQRPTSHIVGDEEYAFAHTLVREAAHAMLTEQDRAQGITWPLSIWKTAASLMLRRWLSTGSAATSPSVPSVAMCEQPGRRWKAMTWML